jgi:hypothetical protein
MHKWWKHRQWWGILLSIRMWDPLIYKLWCEIQWSVNYKFQSKTAVSSTTRTATRTRPPTATIGDERPRFINGGRPSKRWPERFGMEEKKKKRGEYFEASSFFFYIGLLWNELNQKDKRKCNFILLHHSMYLVIFRPVWTPEQASCCIKVVLRQS